MKRLFTIGIAAAMITLLAACAEPGDTAQTTTTEGANPPPAQQTEDIESGTLTTTEPIVSGTASPDTAAPEISEETTVSPEVETEVHEGASDNDVIGIAAAKEIALAEVPGATLDHIYEFEFDREGRNQDRSDYAIDIFYDGVEYEIEIDAYTGEVIDYDEEAKPNKQQKEIREIIRAEEAKAIALAEVPGATPNHIFELEFDREGVNDRDDSEYEVEIKFDGVEYGFDINAYTGEITIYTIDGVIQTRGNNP